MFEEYTEGYFMEQARKMGQVLEIDTRQGSVYMDAASGHCIRVAKFYSDLKMTFDMLFIDTCTGDVLEEKAKERRIYRKDATPSYYCVSFVGVEPADMIGSRFMTGGWYFVLVAVDNEYYLQSEILGTETNSLFPKQSLIPVRNTMGLTSATLGELYIAGSNEESDGSLRERLKTAIAGPSENGNKQQYKTWCEGYEGVGRAIITPLGYGENTVKALIISSEGVAPTDALIEEIQQDIDPDSEGLGEGKALIGCKFYAVAAAETIVDVSYAAELAAGYVKETAIASAKKELTKYLKDIALNTSDDDTMLIQYVKVVGILADTPGIKDFSDLQINGASINIRIAADNVGVLGEVTMNVGV